MAPFSGTPPQAWGVRIAPGDMILGVVTMASYEVILYTVYIDTVCGRDSKLGVPKNHRISTKAFKPFPRIQVTCAAPRAPSEKLQA